MPQVRWLGTALRDLEEIKTFYEDKEIGLGDRLIGEILDIDRLSRFGARLQESETGTP